MFNRLKDQAKITDQDPVFKARYIGNTETFTATGRGCTTQLVQRLWDNAEDEQFLKRVKLKITTFGIHLKFLDKKKFPERLFDIENISFCNVDIVVNDRIFSWISRDADDKMWECHAVICSSPEKAKSMSLVLTRAFHIAYKEWRALHTRELRNIERDKRSQSLPTMTLTKSLQGKQSVAKQQSLNVNNSEISTTNGLVKPANGTVAAFALNEVNSNATNSSSHASVDSSASNPEPETAPRESSGQSDKISTKEDSKNTNASDTGNSVYSHTDGDCENHSSTGHPVGADNDEERLSRF